MNLHGSDVYTPEQVLDALSVAVYICEAPGGALQFWNRRAVELWGREPVLGDCDARFCGAFRLFDTDGTPLPHCDSPMAEVLRTGRPHDGEVVIERPDGSRVTVRVHITPLHDSTGRLTGAVNVFHDITEQKHAEDALRLSEERYRAIVENQPDLVCRFQADGALTFANEAYCAYFERSRDEIVGKAYSPIVHPDDLPHINVQIAALSPTNPVVFIENRVIRPDGAVRWTQWTNRALYDDGNVLLEIQSAGRDITERKQAEEDAARLAALVASAESAIYAMTLEGVITSWNRAAERMFGYLAAEAIGQPVSIIVPGDRSLEVTEILTRVRTGDTVKHLETERVSKEGARIPIALTASPIRDATRGVIGISIIARDITAAKQAEQVLQNHLRTVEGLYRLADTIGRAEGLKDVCDAAVDAIVDIAGADRASVLIFDDDGVMRFKAWRGLSSGYRAAVDGHSPWSRDVRAPAPLVVENVLTDPGLGELRDVIAAEGIRALAFIPVVYHGTLLGKFMLYYDAPRRVSADELRLAATIAHHVAFGIARAQTDAAIASALTRERLARAEADGARNDAERANEAKDEFLAMLAHELRNPLGVIATALAVLEGTEPADTRYQRSRAAIRRQTEHLTRLLDDLLDVARITSGRIQLHKAPLDLRGVIEVGVEGQRHRIEAKHQHLQLCVPDEPVIVMGDSVRLQQVFGNLLNNASKYTRPRGTVSVVLEGGPDCAVIRVRDDGAGIPPDRLEWIFDLFNQANPTLARTEGGLGIGLTVARRLVELHGGHVRALSDGLDRGAEFVVELPLAATAALPARPDTAPVQVRKRRILVIEDNDDGREMLVTALRLYGHEVISAATGREGIEQASRHVLDVALVDLGLPDMQGYDVATELRVKIGSGVRLVALTGYGRPADKARSLDVGFHAHLLKPIDPARLLGVLDELT